jgi:hypothetical protein
MFDLSSLPNALYRLGFDTPAKGQMSLILTAVMPFSIGHHHCIKHMLAIKCL